MWDSAIFGRRMIHFTAWLGLGSCSLLCEKCYLFLLNAIITDCINQLLIRGDLWLELDWHEIDTQIIEVRLVGTRHCCYVYGPYLNPSNQHK